MIMESCGSDCGGDANLVWQLLHGEESEWWCGRLGLGGLVWLDGKMIGIFNCCKVSCVEVSFCNPGDTDSHFHVGNLYLAC